MPEAYGPHELRVPKKSGEVPSGPTTFKNFTDDISPLIPPITGAADGKLVIVKDGAPAYTAMKGDATIAEDGTLLLGDGAVTPTKLATESKELFPQLKTAGDHKVAWGVLDLEAAGSSAEFTINHGLEVIPNHVMICPQTANILSWRLASRTKTQLKVAFSGSTGGATFPGFLFWEVKS